MMLMDMSPVVFSDAKRDTERYEVVRARQDHMRGPLHIRTPIVPEALRKKWYGMPPSRITIAARRPDVF